MAEKQIPQDSRHKNLPRKAKVAGAAGLAALGIGVGLQTRSDHSHRLIRAQGQVAQPNSRKSPNITIAPLRPIFDGGTAYLEAVVKPGKPGDPIESTTFSLVDPSKLPAGVNTAPPIDQGATPQGELVEAEFTAPSNENQLKGAVEVKVTATEADGARATEYEKVTYQKSPPF